MGRIHRARRLQPVASRPGRMIGVEGGSWRWSRLRLIILERDLWTCGYCGIALTPEPGLVNSATVDHRVARWEGGSDHPDNLVACCALCQRRPSFFKPEGSREASAGLISLPSPITGDMSRRDG